jgi:hypothetical protein
MAKRKSSKDAARIQRAVTGRRCRRFAPGRRASWACCWIFWKAPRKTQPFCGDGRPHDPSSLWYGHAQHWILLKSSALGR